MAERDLFDEDDSLVRGETDLQPRREVRRPGRRGQRKPAPTAPPNRRADRRRDTRGGLAGLPPTISVEHAGKLLGISRRSAYRAVARGQLPALRLGRRLVVPSLRLLDLLGERDAVPGGDAFQADGTLGVNGTEPTPRDEAPHD